MKYLCLVVAILLISCTKQRAGLLVATKYDGHVYTLISDTTINTIWDGRGKELTFDQYHDYKIHGTGRLINWDISASQNRVLFDSSINLENIKTSDGRFSTKWYGIDGKNDDNWWIIQKSVNVCKNNRLICITPGMGAYRFSKPVDFGTMVNGVYQQSFNQFIGDATYWDNGSGTTFLYTGKQSPAFSIQLQKGSKFKYYSLQGLWKSPGGPDSVYFPLTELQYKDVSGNNLPDSYTGMGLDYFYDGHSRSGSTGIEINNVSIGGFAVALGFSQNGMTLNNDAHTIDYLHLLGNTKYGILETNAQEKGTSINHIYSWGSIYNIVNQGLAGSHQAGNYSYNVANIAGRCIELVHASVGHWFSSSFQNWYTESIGRVINFSGQMPYTFRDCNFNLNCNYDKTRVVVQSNTSYLAFHNCIFRYYDGLIHNVYVHGYMTIPGAPDNYFGGGTLLFK